MDFGKGGAWLHVVCMQGCGSEWDQFVPAGRAAVHTCTECMRVLADAFWALWDAETWAAAQAEIVAEYERSKGA